jgi:hypothetical protein
MTDTVPPGAKAPTPKPAASADDYWRIADLADRADQLLQGAQAIARIAGAIPELQHRLARVLELTGPIILDARAALARAQKGGKQ